MPQNRRYTVKATWQSGETKTLGFVREGRAEAYAAHAHRFGAAVTLTDTETGVVLLEMNGPFPVAVAPERPQQKINSFEWGGPFGGVKRDVFTPGANDTAAQWLDTDGNVRLGGFLRSTGGGGGGGGIGSSSLVYRLTVTGADKASIDTGVDTPDAGSNDWTNGDLLEISVYLRTDEAVVFSEFDLTLNNDTGGNYDRIFVQGANATVSANNSRADTSFRLNAAGASTLANLFAVWNFRMPNFGGTVGNKTMDSLGSVPDGSAATDMLQVAYSLGYRSTGAVTRLKIVPFTGGAKFKVGSQLLIYKRLAS